MHGAGAASCRAFIDCSRDCRHDGFPPRSSSVNKNSNSCTCHHEAVGEDRHMVRCQQQQAADGQRRAIRRRPQQCRGVACVECTVWFLEKLMPYQCEFTQQRRSVACATEGTNRCAPQKAAMLLKTHKLRTWVCKLALGCRESRCKEQSVVAIQDQTERFPLVMLAGTTSSPVSQAQMAGVSSAHLQCGTRCRCHERWPTECPHQ